MPIKKQIPLNKVLIWVATNSYKILQHYIYNKQIKKDLTDSFGYCLLTNACMHGNVKIAKLLLENGWNPDGAGRSFDGFTPLHYATNTLNAGLIHILIKHGADPKKRCKIKNYTPSNYLNDLIESNSQVGTGSGQVMLDLCSFLKI